MAYPLVVLKMGLWKLGKLRPHPASPGRRTNGDGTLPRRPQKDIITIARRMAEAGEITLGGSGEEMM